MGVLELSIKVVLASTKTTRVTLWQRDCQSGTSRSYHLAYARV